MKQRLEAEAAQAARIQLERDLMAAEDEQSDSDGEGSGFEVYDFPGEGFCSD